MVVTAAVFHLEMSELKTEASLKAFIVAGQQKRKKRRNEEMGQKTTSAGRNNERKHKKVDILFDISVTAAVFHSEMFALNLVAPQNTVFVYIINAVVNPNKKTKREEQKKTVVQKTTLVEETMNRRTY